VKIGKDTEAAFRVLENPAIITMKLLPASNLWHLELYLAFNCSLNFVFKFYIVPKAVILKWRNHQLETYYKNQCTI